jgi:phosphate starvation-inducible PhoH-like protein
VHFCTLSSHDVVRHKLVGRIVAAYDAYEAKGAETGNRPVDVPRRKPGPLRP